MKQYLFNRFMRDISKMLNVVKPTQSIVFTQPPFKGWMMPVSKFGTSCTCLGTTMSRLWGLTTAIARLHRKKLMVDTHVDLPFKIDPTIHRHSFLGLQLLLLQIKQCLLQQLLHLQPYQCNRHIFCHLDLCPTQRSFTVSFQFEK